MGRRVFDKAEFYIRRGDRKRLRRLLNKRPQLRFSDESLVLLVLPIVSFGDERCVRYGVYVAAHFDALAATIGVSVGNGEASVLECVSMFIWRERLFLPVLCCYRSDHRKDRFLRSLLGAFA